MAGRPLVVALALVGACGRVGYDAVTDGGADALDGPPAIDAALVCTRACAPCTPRPLGDDFDDGVIGDGWGQVLSTGSTAAEAGGQVALTAAIEGEAWLETALTYDLATQPAIVHLVGIDAAPPNAEVCLATRDDGFRFASICAEAGGAELAFDVPDVPSRVMAFTPATMSWWRLARTGDSFRFATSADGVTWTADVVLTTPSPLAAASHVRVGVGNFSAPPTTAAARFDGVRIGAPPANLVGQAVGYPPASSGDDFDDGLSPQWYVDTDVGGIAEEAGGVARVAPPLATGQTGAAEFTGKDAFDARDSWVAVQATPTLGGGDSGAWFELRHLGGSDGVGFFLDATELVPFNRVDYVPSGLTTVPYDPIGHHHLRLRHAGTTLTWEASADGATWTTVYSATGLFDPRAVVVELGADKYNGAATGDVRFDDLTLGP